MMYVNWSIAGYKLNLMARETRAWQLQLLMRILFATASQQNTTTIRDAWMWQFIALFAFTQPSLLDNLVSSRCFMNWVHLLKGTFLFWSLIVQQIATYLIKKSNKRKPNYNRSKSNPRPWKKLKPHSMSRVLNQL